MSTKKASRKKYFRGFRILNPYRLRAHKLRWYYKNRTDIRLTLYSKPKNERDEEIARSENKMRSQVTELPVDWFLRYRQYLRSFFTRELERMLR